MSEYSFVYITVGNSAEGARIGKELVESRLAACVNLIPNMVSLYWWEGKIERSEEAIVVAKTRTDLLQALTDKVNEMHSYKIPAMVVLPITGGNPAYLNWIRDETQAPEGK